MSHHPAGLLARLLALVLVVGLGLPALAVAGSATAAAAAPGAPLSGRVATSTGAAVGGATVTVHDLGRDGAVVATATTNDEGGYAVADVAEGEYEVLATPPADDPALLGATTAEVSLGGGDEVVDLALEVSNVRGVVRRSDGSPAAAATVESQVQGARRAITYPDGSYRLTIPQGAWDLSAVPPVDNPALDVVTGREVTVAEGVVTADITLSQPRLRGRVLATDGVTAVAGARVQLLKANGTPVPGAVMTTRGDGSYGFAVRTGVYQLQVDPPEVNPEAWVGVRAEMVVVNDEHTPGNPVVRDVTLDGPTVTGVVRAPNGQPVPRALVHVWLEGSSRFTSHRADSTGRYGIAVPLGESTIRIAAPAPTEAYLDHEFVLDVPHIPYEHDLTFLRPNVTGRVVTRDGLPVGGARVRAYGPNAGTARASALTDRNGRFGLLVAAGSTQRLVADPRNRSLEGVRTARVVEVPAEGAVDDVEIALDPAPVPSFDLLPISAEVDGAPVVHAEEPASSHDGSVIAFRGNTDDCDCADSAPELPSADPSNPAGEFAGVVLHDRSTGEDAVLTAPGGVLVDPSGPVALDDDGSTVAFRSDQNGLVAGDEDDRVDLFVLDRESDTISRIERPEDASFDAQGLTLSGDGRRLAARYTAIRDGEDFYYGVAVIDLGGTGAETARQVLADGRGYVTFHLSRDGGTVAWTQWHRPAGAAGQWQLHVLDLDTGVEDPIRRFSEGIDEWNGSVGSPSLSDDGSVIAYGDVLRYDVPGGYDIWTEQVRVADRAAGTDRRLDPFRVLDEPRAAGIGDFVISGDGTELLVSSRGGVPEEDDAQAWVVSVADGSAELVSRAADGGSAVEGVSAITAPADFSTLVLETSSEDLSGTGEPFVVLAVGESVLPEWPDGAAVTVAPSDLGSTSLRLQWTEATDNVRVAGYRVFRGGDLVGTTDAATRQLRLTGLTPDTSYTFTVQAVDGRAGVSTDGPSVTVRTLPEDSTELRPLQLATAAGGVVDLAWEQAPGADAMVLRTYLGDSQVDERTLPGAAETAQERGLAAGTAYTFQVFRRVGDALLPWSQRGTVTTRALTFGALTWTVPTVRPDVARRGSTATITATAETGREVTVAVEHLSWYDDEHELLDEPRPVTSVVPLAEDPATPGTYTGGFEVVDGVARIVKMTGTVSDGHSATLDRASSRAAIQVSSSVVVTVDAPSGALPDARLQVYSDANGQAHTERITGGTVVALEQLRSARDYVVQVVDARGVRAAERFGVAVRDGLATALTVKPRLPATLTVGVAGPGGTSADGAQVELLDADTDDYLASRTVHEGKVDYRGGHEGQRVEVAIRYGVTQMLEQEDPQTVTLDVGDNRVDVVARSLPRQTVSGTVRYGDGGIAPGARVTMRQTIGREQTLVSGVAGPDGRYELHGLARAGAITVRSGLAQSTAEVDLTAGAVTRDVTLEGQRTYTARLRLFVRLAGSGTEAGPIALDWRTAVHYGMTMYVDGVSQGYTTPQVGPDGAALAQVTGFPGQQLRWCISGTEAKVQRTCVETELGVERSLPLEMHAGPGTDVVLRALDPDGQVLADADTVLYRLDDDGRRSFASASSSSKPRATHRVPSGGTYVVEASRGELSAEATFTVGHEEERVDLGDLVLQPRSQFTGADNSVSANRAELLPVGDVELRASWRNNGRALTGVVARIAVPTDAALIADSLVVDGRPVESTTGPGHVDVTLGAIPRGGTGTLRYRLRAAPGATGLVGRVDLRYPGSGSETITEPLNPVTVPIARVTVTGPDTLAEARLPLSGRAPAGRTVTITDGGVPVGSATAGPGGYWSASVPLAEQAVTQPEHRLVAMTEIDGQRFFAEHVARLDTTRPAIESVSMYQMDGAFPNGRKFTFDPLDGVARFPFVFVPGQELRVEVTFDEPSLVSRVDVLIGSTRVTATRRGDGVFVASTLANVSGPIRVDYDAIAKPLDLDVPGPSDREVRDGVPAPLSGFELSEVVQPDTSGSGPRTGGFTMSIPSTPGGSVRSTLTVSHETYTPTEADIAMQRATGAPAYAVSATRSGNTLELSMLVPLSELPGLADRVEEQDRSPAGGAMAQALRDAVGPDMVAAPAAAGAAVGVARVGYQLAFNGATTLDSLLSALGAGDKYEKLSEAVDAASGCSPGAAAQYADRAENIAIAAAVGDVLGAALSVGSVVFGPATFGLGTVALGVLGVLVDKAVGYAIDQATEELMADIAADDDCEDDEEEDEDDDPPPPVADPVWIYDPSGYVYEGARSVRIPGVTATLLTAPSESGPWTAWDAEWFGQSNPQTTDDAGRYGWDVPEGWWKVVFSKDGYRPASSRVLRVLPPHLDVDVSMVKDGFPHVAGSQVEDGGLEVTFDRLVRSASATRSLTVVDAEGTEVPGTWEAIGATAGDEDRALQRGLRFEPATAPTGERRLTVTVDTVADYSGRLMAEPYSATLTLAGPDEEPDAEVPDAPASVTATAGERSARVSWALPAANGAALVDQVVTVLPSGRQLSASATATSIDVGGLAPGTAYRFTVTARNAVGSGPASAPSNEVVPTAVAPETSLVSGPRGFVASRKARLTWSGTGSSYDCRLDGRPTSCGSTGTVLHGLGSGTHTFSVAARDADGDTDPTPAVARWTVPRDDRALGGRTRWRMGRSAATFDRTYAQATARGTTLTARVEDAVALALVVARGRRYGTVTVYVGKQRIRTVRLAGRASREPQVVPLATFARPRSGTVRIVVTSARRVVRVDGLGVETRRGS